ncbi:putative E4 product [human papillomavirus 150]|uniref:Putative E4 product n=1 Tax=human papillomavirus 150 TaxID=743811 RepID=D3VNF3_9PAPI|nr:putative E4 product [human papillomavirus 150]
MLAGLVQVVSGKFVLTGKLCLLLSPAPRRPPSRKAENGPSPSPPTSPKQPPTPAPFCNGKPDLPNGLSHEKGEGTSEKNLALLPPPSGAGKGYQELLHGKKTSDGQEAGPRGDSKPTKPLHGDGDNDRPGSEPEAGAGAGAVAGAEAGGGTENNPREGGVEGGTSLDLEVDLLNPDLLTNLAYYRHKWEQEYNLLVENILQELRGYWQKLSTPQ